MHDAFTFTLLAAAKAVNPQDDWGLVFSTVLTGMVVVFLVLVLLIVFLELIGAFFSRGEKKKNGAEDKSADIPVTFPVSVQPQVSIKSDSNSENEIIAAIAAAVAAVGASEGKSYTVKSIKKKEKAVRSGWASAGIRESMSRFSK